MYTVRKLHSSNANGQLVELDQFVKDHPFGSFYHLSGWQIIFKEVCHYQTLSLYTLNRNNPICGILLLVLLKNIMDHGVIISLSFISCSGLLIDYVGIENELIKKAMHIGYKFCARYIEFSQSETISKLI